LSADGRVVAFGSPATNLVPGGSNGFTHVYVHDRQAGTTELVSVSSTGVQANSDSFTDALSADGRFVAFESCADDLVVDPPTQACDVFVHDRTMHTTSRVSVDSHGVQGDFVSLDSAVSADGRMVAFRSFAANLVPGDTNGQPDVFVRDRVSGTTIRVSVDSAGGEANGNEGAFQPVSISADGRF